MTKNKLLLNLTSLSIGFLTYIFIFGPDFLLGKTTFFYNFDHPLFLTGYLAFINDTWHFPLAVTDNIYPNNNFSIVWTDSIPIFSIILKIIYSLVGIKLINPFPLWYLLCFILLSFYIGKILQLKIDNYFFYILGITLLTNTPLMVNRMIFHSALSAHWLVVAGIYYYLLNRQNKYNHLNSHAVNTGLSLFIHPYIFTIVFPIYFVSLVNGFYKKNFQNIFRSILIFSSLIVFYTFGFLTNFNQGVYKRPDYVKYRAEFNSFFCGEQPIEIIDKYLWCYPPYTQIHHEGYGYLGIGIIFLFALLIFQPKKTLNSLKENYFMLLVLIAMVLYSFGNKWKIAHVQIFEFEPIDIHKELLYIFRSTGRYTWAFYYFLCFFVVIKLLSIKNKSVAGALLLIATTFQINESVNIYPGKSGWFQLNEPPVEQLSVSKKIINNDLDKILHVLPDERCASMPQADHYIIALEFLNAGGTVQSTRTSRLLLDFDFCNDYSINKSLDFYDPYHFVIADIQKVENNALKNYTCENLSRYIHTDSNPAYCKKN